MNIFKENVVLDAKEKCDIIIRLVKIFDNDEPTNSLLNENLKDHINPYIIARLCLDHKNMKLLRELSDFYEQFSIFTLVDELWEDSNVTGINCVTIYSQEVNEYVHTKIEQEDNYARFIPHLNPNLLGGIGIECIRRRMRIDQNIIDSWYNNAIKMQIKPAIEMIQNYINSTNIVAQMA